MNLIKMVSLSVNNKEIVTNTLKYVAEQAYKPFENVGFVDVRVYWDDIGLPMDSWPLVHQTLEKNRVVTIGHGQPYNLEVTSVGYKCLRNEPEGDITQEIENFKLDAVTTLHRRSYIKRGWFRFVTQVWRKKLLENAWGQLVVGGLIVYIIGETIKALAHHFLPCWFGN